MCNADSGNVIIQGNYIQAIKRMRYPNNSTVLGDDEDDPEAVLSSDFR
jgi:hypothetical protein